MTHPAISEPDPEHTGPAAPAPFVAVSTPTLPEGWSCWDDVGGLPPKGRVDLYMRNGGIITDADSNDQNWTHTGSDADIIGYRAVRPVPVAPPREDRQVANNLAASVQLLEQVLEAFNTELLHFRKKYPHLVPEMSSWRFGDRLKFAKDLLQLLDVDEPEKRAR